MEGKTGVTPMKYASLYFHTASMGLTYANRNQQMGDSMKLELHVDVFPFSWCFSNPSAMGCTQVDFMEICGLPDSQHQHVGETVTVYPLTKTCPISLVTRAISGKIKNTNHPAELSPRWLTHRILTQLKQLSLQKKINIGSHRENSSVKQVKLSFTQDSSL